ncbi:expressed unknown protein [Seminavis robusta]|uniref:CRAL-TRIO domain-containing protein n=1 Tax=Seminavis robusta TaxID=568900 RepID=A0A9N8E9P8_9STRA|nr:expressed unknown protein [Seminavis robusta]|eukprot:Sro701_g189780.1 n/a (302) ;mRNA; f:21990-22895
MAEAQEGSANPLVDAALPAPSIATRLTDQDYNSNALSYDEIEWAHAIKQAVEEDEDLQELTDFEYAHYAIFTHGDTDNAVDRIRNMQEFRAEYKISNTAEEGIDLLQEMMTKQQPWLVLDMDYSTEREHFTLVLDYSRLQPSKVKTPEDWRIMVGGQYYLHQIIHATIPSIQKGMVRICDVEGFEWKNFSVDFICTCYHHLFKHYPIKHQELTWMHSSSIANLLHSLFKSMDRDFATSIRLGCQIDCCNGKLETIFLTPTPEVAEARLLKKCCTFMAARYYNQNVFRLPERDATETTDAEE